MADLALAYGEDLVLSPSGDLALVEGPEMVRQRIIRRLYTPGQSYIWHLEYGAGLPQRIGRVARARNIQALVRSQIGLEASVAKVPVPTITVDDHGNGLVVIGITYVEAATGKPLSIKLELPGR